MTLQIRDCRRAAQVRFRITKAEMLGPSRKYRVSRPRMIAMSLALELTGASLGMVGKHFGGRDHTTVIHARRKTAELSRAIPAFGEDVEHLRMVLTIYKAQRQAYS